jgi:hypothetical protein
MHAELFWNRRAPRFTAEERGAMEGALSACITLGAPHLEEPPIIRAMLDGEKEQPTKEET